MGTVRTGRFTGLLPAASTRALILAATTSTLALLAVYPPAAHAAAVKNTLRLQTDVWVSQLRFFATFDIGRPGLCAGQPVPLTHYCKTWRDQEADFIVAIYRGARRIYDQTNTVKGGTWTARIHYAAFAAETRGCKSGRYRWTVTMIDPYVRPN